MSDSPFFSNPPPGLDLTENRTSANNAIGIALFVLAVIAVTLRIISRIYFQKVKLGPDDYFMLAGLLLGVGNLACCIAGGYYGLGKHIWTLGPDEMEKISIITFYYVFIYSWSVTLVKYSILLFYRRIFGMTWLAWWCVFLTTGYLITNHIVLPLYCKPLSYYWNQWHNSKGGHCPIDEANFYLGVGIINMIGDFCILLVPLPAVLKLQMPPGKKVAVYFIFLLGSFVCVASIIRIRVIIALTKTIDISWAKSDVFIWSSVEPSVGIISGCLPTLRCFFVWLLRQCGLSIFVPNSTRENYETPDGSNLAMNGEDDNSRRNPWSKGRARLRPDDELCLTTICATKADASSLEGLDMSGSDTPQTGGGGITVHKQFQLNEGTNENYIRSPHAY
ncbi:hypothetical protein FQN57_000052 [Myotisia sp. PD_48]|nr:hypothetical protein FQN57_000052 [Myotisia sp. PD_48]